ncbi:MAG: polysaccharide biosynthesis/export family protein [Candidatus Eiseniibacteriota bacterium]
MRATLRAIAPVLLGLVCASGAFAAAAPASAPATAPPADTMGVDWSTVPEYRIVPGDLLTLDFGPRADLNGDIIREITVRPDGRISVFPVGDVVAAGHSPRELEAQLVKLLAADIREPRVTVELTKMAANQVHVLGEVFRPGPYPADPYLTVVQAIAAAGGFKEGANKNAVLVFSRNGSSTVNVQIVHVDNELKMGGLAGDLRLSRFDIVYVPRGPVGNLEAYSRLFFGSIHEIATTAIVGWELFNLDRVFFVPTSR